MKRTALALLSCLAAATPVHAQDGAAMTAEARTAVKSLGQRLGAELKKELETGGPEAAIKVCKNVAPSIAGEISLANGWRVSRVSLKPRNALLGTADAWEQKVLADFDQRVAKGEKAEALEFSEVVAEPQGSYFRYMKAIPTQDLCQACHGTPDKIPAEVKARLQAEYPRDKATGYGIGQVRGAITVKRPL
jgi:hypothetical protein